METTSLDRKKILNILQRWYYLIYGNEGDQVDAIKMCMNDLEITFQITGKEKDEYGIRT